MSIQQVNGYVAAMFEIAVANDALAAVEDEMFRLARAYETNEALRGSLDDSTLPVERRQKIVEQLLGGKAHNVTVQLASMLVGTGHVTLLPQVADPGQPAVFGIGVELPGREFPHPAVFEADEVACG